MIEEAARAIQMQVSNRSRRGRPWDATPEALKKAFREEARQALEAVKPLIKAA